MNIDHQHLISKMEGFATQGIQGAAKNHQQRVSELRSKIRELINQQLRVITDDPKAKMHWKNYWRNIIQCYQIVIEGWPEHIPFANLSEVSSGLPDLEMLLHKWESGEIHWRQLSETGGRSSSRRMYKNTEMANSDEENYLPDPSAAANTQQIVGTAATGASINMPTSSTQVPVAYTNSPAASVSTSTDEQALFNSNSITPNFTAELNRMLAELNPGNATDMMNFCQFNGFT
ncbi:hypothetical protein SERLA73DRAFT_154090 [Serpula lacrymans var. lacrymans S7.3]|uniref:Uncharacterized protein n=1 Tax=Serpula lacrymans var. lacrymans (strain S7.3) TaxID=936435 RepID=F8Q4U4_SERL3|nr:hypothetical protein SERLA73DRAFT_154090 [Serpula lacrymans var. lacrymans S7.3]